MKKILLPIIIIAVIAIIFIFTDKENVPDYEVNRQLILLCQENPDMDCQEIDKECRALIKKGKDCL